MGAVTVDVMDVVPVDAAADATTMGDVAVVFAFDAAFPRACPRRRCGWCGCIVVGAVVVVVGAGVGVVAAVVVVACVVVSVVVVVCGYRGPCCCLSVHY